MKNKGKTWLVTGGSQGIGLVLTKQLLAEGFNVAVTGRKLDILKKAVGTAGAGFLPLEVDLVSEQSVGAAVQATIDHFGSIEVLVNNAGYGLMGGIEESSNQEVQANFDVNVFGLLNVTRAVLPFMRSAGSGHIFNISSILGLTAFGGWGVYCGTKFALEGLSEALAQEVKAFGIQVTIIEPGYFRTNFLNSGSVMEPAHPIGAYRELAEGRRIHKEEIPGTQIGDPQKAAEIMIRLAGLPEAPLRLLMGSDALQFANAKVQALQAGIEANKELTVSTDFK